MPLAEINGVNYAFETWGLGTSVVMLHGFTGSRKNWSPLVFDIQAFTDMLAVDLLGHGETDAPPDPERYSMQRVAADVAEIIQQFARRKPVTLLGYSMGGRLALYIALKYPQLVGHLILESASPGLKTESERQARRDADEQLAQRIESEGIEAFVDFWENIPLFKSQKISQNIPNDWLRTQRLNNNPVGLANSLRGMGTGSQPSLWLRLDELEMPVTLIVGEYDTKFRAIAEEMAAQICEVALHVVVGAGHTVHVEQPQRYTELVMGAFSPD